MKMKHWLFLITLIFCFEDCSFNKSFLVPDKVPVGLKSATIKTEKDSIAVFFNGVNHQPFFTNNGRDTLDIGFKIESVIFKSNSGNNVNGWLLKPKNSVAKITLMHLHGNAGFLLSQFKAISPLIRDSIQIFMFDYSGFGFSEGEATRENALTDALSAMDYIKERKDVKNTKVIIYGQSFGGHLAAVVAAKRQNEIAGAVIEGGFSSPKDIAAHQVPVIGRILVKQGYSAIQSIKDYHKPLLVIHSIEDHVIPFYMGRKIFDNANEPKQFYEVKKCHICAPDYYSEEILQRIKTMLTL